MMPVTFEVREQIFEIVLEIKFRVVVAEIFIVFLEIFECNFPACAHGFSWLATQTRNLNSSPGLRPKHATGRASSPSK
jgi:hypothetical protein